MKIKADKLIAHIEKVRMGGLIDEVALDKNFSFCAASAGSYVLATSNFGLGSSGFGPIGIYDLSLFIKVVTFAATKIFSADEELEFTLEGKYLVFKKGTIDFKFLLCSVDVISSTITPDALDKAFKKPQLTAPAVKVVIKKEDFDKVVDAIGLTTPDTAFISVKDGRIDVVTGIKDQHSMTMSIGATKSKSSFNVKLFPGICVKVFQALPYDEEITMELRKDGAPVVFLSKSYTFLMSQQVVEE